MVIGVIDERDARQALTDIVIKIRVPILALMMTEVELVLGDDYGICRNIPWAVLYRELEYQGLGLHYL